MTPSMSVPHCPFCNAELAAVGYFNWRASGWIILCVHCPEENCRKVLHIQVLPDLEAAGIPGDPRKPIIQA